jgi:hypothetical protein
MVLGDHGDLVFSQIDMLMAAKTYKAENHGVQWEIAKNHVRQQHIVEKIRALQLLRVTKGNVRSSSDTFLLLCFHSWGREEGEQSNL